MKGLGECWIASQAGMKIYFLPFTRCQHVDTKSNVFALEMTPFQTYAQSQLWLLWQWERIWTSDSGRKTLTRFSRSSTTTKIRGFLSGNSQRWMFKFDLFWTVNVLHKISQIFHILLEILEIFYLVLNIWTVAGIIGGARGWVQWKGKGTSPKACWGRWAGDHFLV